jgi:hypothetical protein
MELNNLKTAISCPPFLLYKKSGKNGKNAYLFLILSLFLNNVKSHQSKL